MMHIIKVKQQGMCFVIVIASSCVHAGTVDMHSWAMDEHLKSIDIIRVSDAIEVSNCH